MDTYLFSGYARLPQDVSHQALYNRVGVVVEVDKQGRVVACDSTLIIGLAKDFFARLVTGRSVFADRELIESTLRTNYLGHSAGALASALKKVFDAVDHSPLAPVAVRERTEARGDAGDGAHAL